jgi:S1-C subfamily serine protease
MTSLGTCTEGSHQETTVYSTSVHRARLIVAAFTIVATPTWAQTGTPSGSANPSLSTEAIAARAVPATVSIIAIDGAGDTLGFGSGFLVKPTGVIITNFHVMDGSAKAVVLLDTGERYERVEVLDSDEAADIAILKIPGYGLPILPTSADLPPVGAAVVAVGNPKGLSRTVSTGIVSAVRLVEGRQLVQISAPISPGSSGGPVLNDHGEVIAIATSYIAEGQNLNFAVPVRYAMGLVESAGNPQPLAMVFASNAANNDAPASTRDGAVSNGRSLHQPARAMSPRPVITGSWTIDWHFVSGSQALDFTGFMLLGFHDVGLAAWKITKAAQSSVFVFATSSHKTLRDGQLSLVFGKDTMVGYQTDAGLYFEGAWTGDGDSEPIEVTAIGSPRIDPPGQPTGLYQITGDTRFYKAGVSAPPRVRWTGEAAVVVANDSVYMDLFMTSDSFGTAASTGVGALHGNAFKIVTPTHESISGRFDRGRLTIDWIDERKAGPFKGILTGQRH